VTASVLLAIAVPTIGPFVNLLGAFCFSILGLLAPVFIEMVTYWDEGFGKYNWLVWKNLLVCAFGVFALVFGSKDAIIEIMDMYSPSNSTLNATTIAESTTAAVTKLIETTLAPLTE
jgi:proton-coupled amino acid transporter